MSLVKLALIFLSKQLVFMAFFQRVRFEDRKVARAACSQVKSMSERCKGVIL